jgi:Zn-dependent metalloprotease
VDANDPHRVIKAFLNEHSALFGHDSSILVSAKVERDYVTEYNGLHTTIWQQTLDDIPVFEALLTGHVTRDGELVSISSHLVPVAATAADAGTPGRRSLQASPTISAAKAISISAPNVGVEVAENGLIPAQPQGAQKAQDTPRAISSG